MTNSCTQRIRLVERVLDQLVVQAFVGHPHGFAEHGDVRRQAGVEDSVCPGAWSASLPVSEQPLVHAASVHHARRRCGMHYYADLLKGTYSSAVMLTRC